jgi:hypothetical protein
LRIEELEESLLKTSQQFGDTRQTIRKRRQSEIFREFDFLIAGAEDGSDSVADSTVKAELFQGMLSGKLHFLEEQRSILEKELQGSSSDELRDGRTTRKRKSVQEVERLVQKERRRRVVRSRNQIVDNWLQMDQNIGQDEGYDDDAYADLEDFLADG